MSQTMNRMERTKVFDTYIPRCPKCHSCKVLLYPKEVPSNVELPERRFRLQGAIDSNLLHVYCMDCTWQGPITEVSYERV